MQWSGKIELKIEHISNIFQVKELRLTFIRDKHSSKTATSLTISMILLMKGRF